MSLKQQALHLAPSGLLPRLNLVEWKFQGRTGRQPSLQRGEFDRAGVVITAGHTDVGSEAGYGGGNTIGRGGVPAMLLTWNSSSWSTSANERFSSA
jgi:hypothetical protein